MIYTFVVSIWVPTHCEVIPNIKDTSCLPWRSSGFAAGHLKNPPPSRSVEDWQTSWNERVLILTPVLNLNCALALVIKHIDTLFNSAMFLLNTLSKNDNDHGNEFIVSIYIKCFLNKVHEDIKDTSRSRYKHNTYIYIYIWQTEREAVVYMPPYLEPKS